MANRLAQELRRALIANPYSPAAAVRVVSAAELAHEMRLGRAVAMVSGFGESPPGATLLPVEFAD